MGQGRHTLRSINDPVYPRLEVEKWYGTMPIPSQSFLLLFTFSFPFPSLLSLAFPSSLCVLFSSWEVPSPDPAREAVVR